MPLIDEKELKKQIKEKQFTSLYFICGDEAYLKKFYVGRIAEVSVPDAMRDFNEKRFEGKNIDFDELSNAVEAFPMMSDRRCVIIKDLPVDELSQTDKDKLMTIISDIPSTTTLVMWMDHVEVQPKKNAKWKKFISEIESFAQVAFLDKRGSGDLVKLVVSGAQKRGCILSPDNAAYLISLVGDDMTNLLSELEKLCAFRADKEISKKDIDAIAVKTVEAVVFDLTKAMMSGDAGRAFTILNELLRQKTEPIMILGVIISQYVDMYRVKVVMMSNGRAEDAAKIFNYKGKEFRLRNAARDGKNMSLRQIRECLDILAQCDSELKGSGLDSRILLEKCITRLMLVPNS